MQQGQGLQSSTISVFLADDNLIVREGVRALIALEDDFSVVGTAADYDELVTRASELAPQVVVTDIRMPPTFQQEGIQAAHEIPQAPPRHRDRRPVAVRRPGVRHLAARRGLGRLCLPVEGQDRRG